jgi:outer membrane protein OmpA-like peptidoglycan-associated protein
MRRSLGAMLVFALLGTAATGTALAADSRLQLVMGGEAYDGPPRFAVLFNGREVGEASVDAAIDTASAGRFAAAGDKTPYVQAFDFTIPEALFKPGGEVRIRFLNEANGGEGTNRDRNLYLASVAVNGRAVTVSGLGIQGQSADVAPTTLGEFLVIPDSTVEAVSRPPAGGWPLPGAEIAAAATPATAAQPAPAPDEVKTASISPPAPASEPGACSRDELYNVIGFNESSNDLTPRLMQRLDQILADVRGQKCRIQVTGYSSRQGNHATSALFAVERARKVLTYLKDKGMTYARATVAGGGATDQFGPEPSANRRVVITVRP